MNLVVATQLSHGRLKSSRTTFESLADSGKFASLDVKLGRAAREAAANNVTTCDILGGVNEETIMRGRQAVLLIYQYYATTGIKNGLTSITVLMAVRLDRDPLQEFLSTWDQVLLHIDEGYCRSLGDVLGHQFCFFKELFMVILLQAKAGTTTWLHV